MLMFIRLRLSNDLFIYLFYYMKFYYNGCDVYKHDKSQLYGSTTFVLQQL